ncbi:MAG TPA: AraC family transcriptional regulator [Rhizobacter sp.]|nr:AraC family transcriptional regulator [Rhizobacter sp.]
MSGIPSSFPVANELPATRRRDLLVLLEDGYLFAGPWVVSETARFSAAIALTVAGDGDTFEYGAGGEAGRCEVLVTRPHARRRLGVRGVPIVAVGISPNHACYRLFRSIGGHGSLCLPRALFSPLDAALRAVYEHRCSLAEVQALFAQLVAAVATQLPTPVARENDPRIRRVLRMLHAEPAAGLDELAAASGLSYDRMSHLFAEEVGLPMRSYQLAQKVHLATQLVGSGLSLTEIALAAGFADSAHLSKVWLRAYGGSPTHFFSNERVRVMSAFHPSRQDASVVS